MNPQIRTHSGTAPGTFRNTNLENQGTSEGDSQSDLRPKAGIFHSQTTQNSGPEVGPDMVTGVSKEIRNGHDMLTGVTEDIRNRHNMVTGVQQEIRYRPQMVTGIQEDIPYCSLWTSSGKQRKARSTSQPQFRSQKTPLPIEADQVSLTLLKLASNSNSANINNNKNKISKLPTSLTTSMPTFDGKWEKFELFEDLFRTSLKIQKNQLTEGNKINYFHSLMRGDALQTFKNTSSRNRENLAETLIVYRRKYMKHQ